ncbi:GNAT family N-acetyltransferase [Hydrogenimonas sp.]
MKIEVVTSEDELLAVKESWQALFDKTPEATALQSFEWNYAWWNAEKENHDLFIIAYTKDKVLSAIFPFWIDRTGTLRFIADTHTDHCDFLIDHSDISEGSDSYVMFKHVTQQIFDAPRCKRIELKNLSHDSRDIGIFTTFFDHKQMLCRTNGTSSMHFIPQENFFHCFAHLNAKKKQVIKQMFKHHKHLHSRIYSGEDEYPDKKIETLVRDMIDRGERSEEFFSKEMLSMFKRFYDDGILVVHEVYDEREETIAINLVIRLKNDTLMFWIDLFKDIKKINVFSNLLFIRRICEARKEPFTLDFGRGIYEYKIKNFQPSVSLQYTFFYAKESGHFFRYVLQYSMKLILKNFYKKHKSTINRLLLR